MLGYILGIGIILISIGLIYNLNLYFSTSRDYNELAEYTSKFVSYLNNLYSSKTITPDNSTYVELLTKSAHIQSLLGDLGRIDYQEPFTNYVIRNLQIVINFIPHLQNPQYKDGEFRLLQSVLLIRIGQYEELLNQIKKDIKNPLILLREGIQFIVTLPISLMFWTGLIQYSTKSKIYNSFFIKFVSFIIVFLGLISSIITIVSGWNTIDFIIEYLNQQYF